MANIHAQGISYKFENGETLFTDITFSLDQKITALVGRNGVGKSRLASILAGESSPSNGTVTLSGRIGFLKQIGADTNQFHYETISDALGLRKKLEALSRIESGSYDTDDFELVGEDWLVRKRIDHLLLSIGLPADPFLPFEVLSGGQLARLALHQLFSAGYDYLILDEPGNHLDEQGTRWLIDQLHKFSGGILIISHNRDILRGVDDILELTPLGVKYYGGPYDIYTAQRSHDLSSHERKIQNIKTQIKNLHKTTQENREKAQKRAAQGKKSAHSRSQAKILINTKKQAAEKSNGNRENNQLQQINKLSDRLSSLNIEHNAIKSQNLDLGHPDKKSSRLLHITEVQLPYGSNKEITFTLDYGEKLHITGKNGSGKSTLLKTIAGNLSPCKGTISVSAVLRYLDQDFTLLNNNKTSLENLALFCPHLSETDLRTLLGGIGLRNDKVMQKASTLSGGEKMKVAMLAVSNHPGNILLLLDEPDNHLDIDSKDMLARALSIFPGSIVVVSHDKDFIREIGVSRELML